MKLVIVESPSKAKTIAKYLGAGYKVLASGGHVSDLPPKRLGIDVKNNFKPEYEITPTKKATVDTIRKELAKSDGVYLATDPDREGEAISWHLSNVCGIKDDGVRIEFNEISKKAVNAALEHPRKIDMNLVDAQQARRVLDRLVGYEASPILSRKIKSGLSAGRVQSVALEMIVEREREIRAFKPEEYWVINAFVDGGGGINKCDFNDLNGKKTKVGDKQTADAVVEGSKAGRWSVDSVKRAQSLSKPNPPFTTSTMQQDASAKLNFTAARTMQIAQQLYEGVDLPVEGHVAFVTYIRTDSVRIAADAQSEALNFIREEYGADYVPARPNVYTTNKNAQDAHEAIRPISLTCTPESLKDKLQRDQYKLYKLIYDRFVASQMAPAVYDTLTVKIVSDNGKDKFGYSLKGRTLKFKGYTAAYTSAAEGEEGSDASKLMPNLTEGQALIFKDIKSEQKFTKPPLRYTDATFIKAMEENGIGRPSTYATTISVIAKREYTAKDGKFILPTDLGELVCDQLIKYFPDIMNIGFTSDMETKLDKIEEGGEKWYKVVADFYPGFHQRVEYARSDGERVKPKEEVSDVKCEKCGAMMVVRDSRYGKFLACPNFPKCRNTKPYGAPAAKCPVCGRGVYEKVSKKGAKFFSCSGYPECKFISWDLPAPYFCPDCNSIMKIVRGKDGSEKYVCTNKDCRRTDTIKTGGEAPQDE